MRLLLHICCAPCLVYPLRSLKEKGYEVGGFFYNPNIHPFAEYEKRGEAVREYAIDNGVGLIQPEYRPQGYFQAVNLKEAAPGRCEICWRLRLKETARQAKKEGFTHFSSTLLVSPYQDQGALRKIGSEIALEEYLEFYYEDFRPGFRKAHDEARARGIYCQRYCGCIYSEIEREKERKSRTNRSPGHKATG